MTTSGHLSDEERERIYADAYVAELRRQSGRDRGRIAAAKRVAKQVLREAIARAGLVGSTGSRTSLKQALNRMQHVHARILRGARLWSGASLAEGRGYSRAKRTLIRWGAMGSDGTLTPFGQDLLAAWTTIHGNLPPWAARGVER